MTVYRTATGVRTTLQDKTSKYSDDILLWIAQGKDKKTMIRDFSKKADITKNAAEYMLERNFGIK